MLKLYFVEIVKTTTYHTYKHHFQWVADHMPLLGMSIHEGVGKYNQIPDQLSAIVNELSLVPKTVNIK